MDLKEHLKTLTEMAGPSGHEGPVRGYLREAWQPFIDEFQVDGLGSLIALRRGSGADPRRRLMLSVHMDEIAMMVSEVREGYLRVVAVAGMDARTLQGKSVVVHGQRPLLGTVAAVPPHISAVTGEGRHTYPPLALQWIDLGLPAEEVAALVTVGDLVTLDAPMLTLKNERFAGKAMDDRCSIAAVSWCLELLQRINHKWDVYAVASVQEENGLYGAATAAYSIAPDVAIAIDVGFAKQPGVNDDRAVELGKGPTLGIGPNFHPGLRESLLETAKALEMTLPPDPLPGSSGTDAWAIQVARQGVPTALLSIPLRNMHSTVETVSMKDIKRTGRLLAEFIGTLDDTFLEKITWKRKKDKKDDSAKNAG